MSGGVTSLVRRTDFADHCRFRLDRLQAALWRPRRMRDIQWGYYGATLAHDLVEAVRSGERPDWLGRPHLAALSAPVRLDQNPRYRAYWYDPERHAMVGTLLGIDLHRHAGRYYVLECNLTAGLSPERRALYDVGIDPLVEALAGIAIAQGFRKVVLHRRSWRSELQVEIAEAGRRFGVELVAASAMREPGDPPINPMAALPEELERDTLYVTCTALSENAVYQFLHQKAQLEAWLPEAIAEQTDAVRLVAAVPGATGPGSVVTLSDDPRWPNLVVKLASSDRGKDILFGRFTSEEAAHAALGLPADGLGLPLQFTRGLVRSLASRFVPDVLSAVYQSFVPPEDSGGYPKMIRMETFVSPLWDALLSAHGTVGGEKIPGAFPENVVVERSPLNVSVPPGRFVRLDEKTESELSGVADEFGRVLRTAITAKFRTEPEKAGRDEGQARSRKRTLA